jgi:signal transduction histidine kinase
LHGADCTPFTFFFETSELSLGDFGPPGPGSLILALTVEVIHHPRPPGVMNGTGTSFEHFAADRLNRDSERITRDWVERLASQLGVPAMRVLPHEELLDHIPLILSKATEFLLAPDPRKIIAEQVVTDEMRNIVHLRRVQGYNMQEIVREFDQLAQLLDEWALRWIDEYPGTPDARSVGRVFGRINRVPLLMGQVAVGSLDAERNMLLRQVASVEEAERIRLSRELHDQMGQLCTALLLGLQSLKREAVTGEQAARIEELEKLADQIAREVQQLALDLRPAGLDGLGLCPALETLLHEWSARYGIETDMECSGLNGERLPTEMETAIYRVVQEGLTNVLKHAGATRVSVLLERSRKFVRLILEDDGNGFDVAGVLASSDKEKRLGLRGMRERTELLGGRLEIESSRDSGTSFFVRIPLPSTATQQSRSDR